MALNLSSDPHPLQAFFYVGTQLLKASHASGGLLFCASRPTRHAMGLAWQVLAQNGKPPEAWEALCYSDLVLAMLNPYTTFEM